MLWCFFTPSAPWTVRIFFTLGLERAQGKKKVKQETKSLIVLLVWHGVMQQRFGIQKRRVLVGAAKKNVHGDDNWQPHVPGHGQASCGTNNVYRKYGLTGLHAATKISNTFFINHFCSLLGADTPGCMTTKDVQINCWTSTCAR